ncbi:MAG TPA: hypothetical protein VNG33_09470, partial [Polyangiaceae bacterium]|nr:hypothetical protein [Polyangiaceae bacterium]
ETPSMRPASEAVMRSSAPAFFLRLIPDSWSAEFSSPYLDTNQAFRQVQFLGTLEMFLGLTREMSRNVRA